MTLPRLLLFLTVALFGTIGIVALLKREQETPVSSLVSSEPIEIILDEELPLGEPEPAPEAPAPTPVQETKVEAASEEPDVDRVAEFFNTRGKTLPIVETVTYKSKVPWLKERSAWIADYAAHYRTSRHFIARSLNGKPDYEKQDASEGKKFNVLKGDVNLEFYLLVDLTKCKMKFYYVDKDKNEKVLVKTYQVGLGRPDATAASGFLTPTGKYMLGDRVVVYKPKVEMAQKFGTRWIPFAYEIADATLPAKGFGVHGLPSKSNGKGEMEEDLSTLGKYESDGCIRLATSDMEELFAIIISRPTVIEIVR